MTREKAIWAMQFYKEKLYNGIFNQYIGAFDMAITALSAQQEHKCPCDLCGYGPPSSMNGKPCTMCPAIPKEDNILDYLQKSAEEADHEEEP